MAAHKGGKNGKGKTRRARSIRTSGMQLAVLDERLGMGQGARRERARLLESISP